MWEWPARSERGIFAVTFNEKPTIRPSGHGSRGGEGTILNPQLANFDDNEGHIVGEGTVPPCSNAVENCLLHIREW